eukprot:6203538-Pleurochrysis_carterae.AAC.1
MFAKRAKTFSEAAEVTHAMHSTSLAACLHTGRLKALRSRQKARTALLKTCTLLDCSSPGLPLKSVEEAVREAAAAATFATSSSLYALALSASSCAEPAPARGKATRRCCMWPAY